MNSGTIGIFDSGVGGLSVWQEIVKLLPNEDIIYFADSKNCPYGLKSHDEIIELSIKNTEFLLSKGCKIIIVACNTATAAAIDILRKKYTVPFIGMEPAVKPAALNTNTGRIGVLATKGTFEGKLFKETSRKYAARIKKIIQIGNGLVELVENGNTQTDKAEELLKKYLNPMINAGVDQIVLGCTHYPFFIPTIKKLIPQNVQIINPAQAVAKQTKSVLMQNNLLSLTAKKSEYLFYTSGNNSVISIIIKNIMGTYFHVNKISL
jgi:glutamate racemase